jgi:hypothetical protein
MKRKTVGVLVTLSVGLAAIAACVGDDPSTSSSTQNDGSVEGDATTSDGPNPGTDSGGQDAGITDSAAVPDADDGGLFELSNLSLWLEADDLSPGLFSTWVDRSGHANNAIAAATTEPFVNTSSFSINGHLVVTFDGGTKPPFLTIADNASLQFDSSGFLIEIVERHPAGPGPFGAGFPGLLLEKEPTATPFPGPSIALTYFNSAGNDPPYPAFMTADISSDASVSTPSPSVAIAAGVPHKVKMRLKNTSGTAGVLSLQVDSMTAITANVLAGSDIGAAGAALLLGKSANAFQFPFEGDIAAVIAVKAPSDADVARVDAYVHAHYGL